MLEIMLMPTQLTKDHLLMLRLFAEKTYLLRVQVPAEERPLHTFIFRRLSVHLSDTHECPNRKEELANAKFMLELLIVVRHFLRALCRRLEMVLKNLGISDSTLDSVL